MRLKNKVAIVTGAGRGIGENIVIRLAEEGAKLITNDVNEADANRTVINRLEIVLTDRSPSPCPLPQDWGRGLG